MKKIRLYSNDNVFLEEISIRNKNARVILYRGRLFERVNKTDIYMQRSYVEIS